MRKTIKSLEEDIVYWRKKWEASAIEVNNLNSRLSQEMTEKGQVKFDLEIVSQYWNTNVLVSTEGDDPNGTVRLPKESIEKLLILLPKTSVSYNP